MMRQFDDPDQAVSWAAILLFIEAAFAVPVVLVALFTNIGAFTNPYFLVFGLGVAAGAVAAGVGLLKGKRWAWPVGLAVAGVGVLLGLSQLPGSIFSIAIDAFVIWLLFRPSVRERFGQVR